MTRVSGFMSATKISTSKSAGNTSEESNIVTLSSLNGHDQAPVWSPDGSKIAFVSSVNDIHTLDDLWVMNSDGTFGNPIRLTFDSWLETNPSWSLDGSKIIFSSNEHGNREIHVLNANSSGGHSTNITNHGSNDMAPSWGR